MQMKRKTLYLTCGIPGSGKSTWCQTYFKDKENAWCSRDEVRFSMLQEDDEYFAHETEVFAAWIVQIKKALRSDVDIICVDATHLSEKARNAVLDRLPLKNVDIIPVSFEVPLDTCLQRNNQRVGRARVPEQVIKNMYNSYTPPSFKEKYDYADIKVITK